jgi:hypothetical protein
VHGAGGGGYCCAVMRVAVAVGQIFVGECEDMVLQWCRGGGCKASSTFYLGVGEWLERCIASQLGHTLLEVVALVNM